VEAGIHGKINDIERKHKETVEKLMEEKLKQREEIL